jgi:hypothetical protein
MTSPVNCLKLIASSELHLREKRRESQSRSNDASLTRKRASLMRKRASWIDGCHR